MLKSNFNSIYFWVVFEADLTLLDRKVWPLVGLNRVHCKYNLFYNYLFGLAGWLMGVCKRCLKNYLFPPPTFFHLSKSIQFGLLWVDQAWQLERTNCSCKISPEINVVAIWKERPSTAIDLQHQTYKISVL